MPASSTGTAVSDGRSQVASTFGWESLDRGSTVVCIPVFGAYQLFAQCIQSVLENTPEDIHILVADDASDDPSIARLVEEINAAGSERPPIAYHRQAKNVGFVHNVNAALRLVAPADAIVLNSDCVVAPGWFEGLRRAAYSDTRVATASPLTNHGTIVSIPDRNRPANLPQDWSLEQAAAAVRALSPGLYPALPSAVGHCLYLRRSALELVGDFDPAFAPGYEEEVDFSQRCTRHGLSHVLADDVFVLHYGGGSFDAQDSTSALREEHHRMITARYPYFDSWVNEVEGASDTPLARSLAAGRRALRGMAVTIDGRVLTKFMTGTQLHALEIIVGLHEAEELPMRVIVPPDLGGYAADVLGGLEHVRLIDENEASWAPATDVVHRPYQVSSLEDLALLLRAGERLVITQQDLIAYHNPAYHEDFDGWHHHRYLTRTALAAADRVAFFSRHARADAVREELVEPARAKVVLLGTDHRLASLRPEGVAPRGAKRLTDRPFLLCLGTDFVHKNRVFAIRLLEALRARHGWDGRLVLAGPHVAAGSSAGEEAEELVTSPGLSEHVVDLAAVDEAGKRWLMDHTAALVYPTTYEGFGLVPFEAGELGVPCFFAPEAALGELFPREAALLVPWDAEASAERCFRVLSDPALRDEHVVRLRAAAASLTWRRTAGELMRVYREAIAAPERGVRGLTAELVHRKMTIGDLSQDAYSIALAEAIPPDMRRPLLAVANRRLLRAIVFPALRALYALTRLTLGRAK